MKSESNFILFHVDIQHHLLKLHVIFQLHYEPVMLAPYHCLSKQIHLGKASGITIWFCTFVCTLHLFMLLNIL